MLGSIDTEALLKVAYASLLAGVAVAIVFSLAVVGAIRSGDMRHAGRHTAAFAYGALAVVAGVLTMGIIVYGVVLVAHTS